MSRMREVIGRGVEIGAKNLFQDSNSFGEHEMSYKNFEGIWVVKVAQGQGSILRRYTIYS